MGWSRNWLFALLFGAVIGAVAGWLAEQTKLSALLQSVISVLVALVASTTAIVMYMWRRHQSAGNPIEYFSVGSENLLYLGILCLFAAVVHLALDRLGWLLPPFMNEHRTLVFGVVGGVYGALSGVRAMTPIA